MSFEKIKKELLNLLYPKCPFCLRESSELACKDCLETIPILASDFCLCSKNPKTFLKCKDCRNEPLDQIISAVSYQDKKVSLLIKLYKYPPYIKSAKESLVYLILKSLLLREEKLDLKNGLLVPVPSEYGKIKERGFDPILLLTQSLSLKLNMEAKLNILKKIKRTPSQALLTLEERRLNLKDAFTVENIELVKGKTIYLIDDVYTTGTTLKESAKVLKLAKAKKVIGITVAREFLN